MASTVSPGVRAEVTHGGYRLVRYSDDTVKVFQGDVEEPARPVLCEIAEQFGISDKNGQGGPHNTRQLGKIVIEKISQGTA